MARELTRCDQCGKTDTAPLAHFGAGRSVHHDCMSIAERELAFASGVGPVVEACESGIKNDDLVDWITKTNGGQL